MTCVGERKNKTIVVQLNNKMSLHKLLARSQFIVIWCKRTMRSIIKKNKTFRIISLLNDRDH